MAILKKFIGANQVGTAQILLEPNTALRAASSTSGAQPLELLKVDSADVLQLLRLPRIAQNPSHIHDIVNKNYVDQEMSSAKGDLQVSLGALSSQLTSEINRATAEEVRIQGALTSESERALAAEALLSGRIEAEMFRAVGREDVLEAQIATKIPLSYIGAANGVTPLDAQQKIPTQYLPALAITEVFVVTTLAQRDALVPAGSVQTGDVVKVTEAVTASDGVSKLPRSYIYDGTQFVELNTESDVDSVNGKVGHVSLSTADIAPQGDRQYLTTQAIADLEGYTDSAVLSESQARSSADSSIRTDFAAADSSIRTDFAAADSSIRTDFAAADSSIRSEFAAADATLLLSATESIDTKILVEQTAREIEDLTFLKLDGSRAMTGALSMQSNKITNLATPTAASDASTKAYVDSTAGAFNTLMGAANGIATLDNQGKLTFGQIPAIAITDVYVVQNIAARDALVIEEGDVAKVIQAELASDGVNYLSRTYIYAVDNQSQIGSWIEIQSESDVMSVAGRIGHVTLDTGDVSEKVGGPVYFTETRAKTAAVVNSISGGELDQAPSAAAAKQYIDTEIAGSKTYTDQQLDTLKVQQLQFQEITADAALVADPIITLTAAPKGKPWVMRQGLLGRPGVDFTVGTGANSNVVTFIGEWAANGSVALEVGELVYVYYMSESSPYLN